MAFFSVGTLASWLLSRRLGRHLETSGPYPSGEASFAGRPEWMRLHRLAFGRAFGAIGLLGFTVGFVVDVPTVVVVGLFVIGVGIFLTAARAERTAAKASHLGLIFRIVGGVMFVMATPMMITHAFRLLFFR